MRRSVTLVVTLLLACTPPPAPPPPVVLVVAADGTFSVERFGLRLEQVRGSVTVNGTDVALGEGATITTSDVMTEQGPAQETRVEQTSGVVRLVLTLRRTATLLTAQLTASCATSCAGQRVEGFTLQGRLGDVTGPPSWVLSNSFSSWAPTYVATLQRSSPPDAKAETTGNNEDFLTTDARVSWWLGALAFDGAALVPGALTAQTWKTRVITFRHEGVVQVRVRSGGNGDSKPLTGEVRSETYAFALEPGSSLALRSWAQAVGRVTPPPAPPFVPVGWNSWNTLFENITEQNTLANADQLAALGFGANNVQLDDGWERQWGEWTANPKFPAGMEGTASSLRARQLTAGVWMAPFYLDATSPTAMAHADWFVRDAQDRPVSWRDFFSGHTYLVLDVTHPDARVWMGEQVRRLVSQGYRYFKFDFLYAGAFEGKRRDDVTSIEALQRGLEVLSAEARAGNAYVVACGAPMLPSVGHAHAFRTGGDIAGRGATYSFEWVKNVARNVGERWFVSPLFANDPDTVLIRGLPDGVKRQQVTMALLAGRLFALGDDLPSLSAGERAFLERAVKLPMMATLAKPGDGFVVIDAPEKPRMTSLSQAEALLEPDSYHAPAVWVASGTSEGTLVGLFNWTTSERTFTLSPAQLGLARVGAAESLWTGEKLSPTAAGLTVTVPPRDAAYLRVGSR
ncbi:MAG: alpha-galactosidase [Myxococcaceae bacterium]|nr:alpha-galactosidase [Myxococcaceae bacterium]